jgi:hypothetical protein
VLRTLFCTFHPIDEKCFQKQMLIPKCAPLMAEESGSSKSPDVIQKWIVTIVNPNN